MNSGDYIEIEMTVENNTMNDLNLIFWPLLEYYEYNRHENVPVKCFILLKSNHICQEKENSSLFEMMNDTETFGKVDKTFKSLVKKEQIVGISQQTLIEFG